MSRSNAKKENKTFKNINIGIVIFAFILVYLIIKIVIFYAKNEISIYEVPAGKVYEKKSYKGFILREEEIIYTDTAGYINYYYLEGDRVQNGGAVYSIGSDKNIYSYLEDSDAEIRLSDTALISLKKTIANYYKSCETQEDYIKLQDKINTVYSRQLDKEVLENLNQIIKDSGINSGFKVVKTQKSGFISYFVDQYDKLTLEELDSSYFSADYDYTYVYNADIFTIDSPAYKLVTSSDWTIAILIDEEMYLRLRSLSTATIIINNEDSIKVNIEPVIINSDYFCYIKLDKYVMRYSDCRILDIVFDIDDIEGLKIPASSVAYRNYYRIPENFIAKDKEGNWILNVENYNQETGVVEKAATIVEVFCTLDGFKYIDADQIDDKKFIFDKNGENKTVLNNFIVSVEGVYNVNNGYAIFRRIERMDEGGDGDYIIVKTGTISGLEIYDHISVNGADVTEGTVIY